MIFNPANIAATPTGTLAPSATPTATATSVTSSWPIYTNLKYAFNFKYPPQGQVSNQTDTTGHITLPFTPGTNLVEKYLDVNVKENANPCTSPRTAGFSPGSFSSVQVVINGIPFTKEGGEDAGAGHFHEWIAYSTTKGIACVSLSFDLHSINPGNLPTPPPVFNESAESAVFSDIVSTFAWINP
jgi:hypothetical protein